MIDIRKALKTKRLYFDGGFGTLCAQMGLGANTPPELWNTQNPQNVRAIHRAYIEAGSNIITTNTFGVNADKYDNYQELLVAAIQNARCSIKAGEEVFVAFDIGPSGKLLQPFGDYAFEDAVELFAKNIRVAAKQNVDLVIIETFNDAYETKAAVLAAKENCDLPIFVTNAYDKGGKLMTGANPQTMISLLEGLGVDALGMNCSFGPNYMLEIIDEFVNNASCPIIVSPNAGLPQVVGGKTVYDVTATEFADYMTALAKKGVTVLGGCCGTTPEYIAETVAKTKDLPIPTVQPKNLTTVSSFAECVVIGNKPLLVGERINPTGKSKLKQALRDGDINYLLTEAINQAEKGAHILDVNVGLPEINEVEVMVSAIKAIQAVCPTPLQIDSTNPQVLEKAMRIYNGKPLINSVNGDEQTLDKVLPLVKKYGGTVIALTIDKNGIPETAEGRVEIAQNIINYAATKYGIAQKDIIVDPLCLTVSSNPQSALITLKALMLLKQKGIKTILGVSNISFGLPQREKINSTFFAESLACGLNLAIMNVHSVGMMDVYYCFNALNNMDFACSEYIAYAQNDVTAKQNKTHENTTLSLKDCIIKGLKDSAVGEAKNLLAQMPPLEVINTQIVPALDEVGKRFELKQIYLPQLLISAEAASSVFDIVKNYMPKGEGAKGEVILATVKGDIHDIGKNIVKVLLESYGFKVYDLGRDVSPEAVCTAVTNTGCKVVGLSALMTTTVPAMQQTIGQLHKMGDVTVIVGGAVLNQEYADMIGAEHYSPDALDTVAYVSDYYKINK